MAHRARGVLLLCAAACVAPTSLAAQSHGESRIVGRVLDADDDRPVAGVTVRLVDLGRVTTSDDRGRFSFDSVPSGDHRVRVRHLGYESRRRVVSVAPHRSTGVTIHVTRKPVEATDLTVTVQTEPRLPDLADEGFYRRRERDSGHFFGPQYLTRWSGTRLGTVLARTPGIRTDRSATTGQYSVRNLSRCPYGSGMLVYVDGRERSGGLPSLPTTEIAAIEVYDGPSQMSGMRYRAGPCGTILIWTWRGSNPFIGDSARRLQCPDRLRKLRPHAC